LIEYQKVSEEIVAASRAGDKETASELLAGKSRDVRTALTTSIGELLDRNVQAVNDDAEVAVSDVKFGSLMMVGAGGITLLLMVGALVALTGVMQRLADNHTCIAIVGGERGDEVGAIARTVQVFKDNALAKTAMDAEQRAALQVRERRTARIEQLITDFDAAATSIVKFVTGNSATLNSTAQQLNGIADAASERVSALPRRKWVKWSI
jgi:methyl-accepting chemotaxis protein